MGLVAKINGYLSPLDKDNYDNFMLNSSSQWIQLVATGDEECKLKVTIGMELNPFMKAMVQKPLQEGLEKMADMLAMIQY